MSHPREPDPVLFFLGVTEKERGFFLREIRDFFEEELGIIAFEGPDFNFSEFTDYYEEEMGKPLWKGFYVFEKLREPEFLLDLKYLSYEIERKTSTSEGKRRVNLDPGYITLSKIVLATFKDYSHRIYLGRSIFGEVTLFYKEGTFQCFPWTYPDYRTKEVIDFFNKVRNYYKEKLRAFR
jgi:hypothetical protein